MSRCDWSKLSARVVLASVVLAVSGPLAHAADGWTEPFNGKDLTGWKIRGAAAKNQWGVGTAKLKEGKPNEIEAVPGGNELINLRGGVDLYTEAKYGDVQVECEIFAPRGSNSGVYLMGEYEIQVLDSFGKKSVGPGDMGGIYNTKAPMANASKAPGDWQKLEVDFRAPRFDADGKKTANAKFVKVVLNGVVIHENVEAPKSTGGGLTGKDNPTGPLKFQGDHGPVAFRNIKIRPIAATQ